MKYGKESDMLLRMVVYVNGMNSVEYNIRLGKFFAEFNTSRQEVNDCIEKAIGKGYTFQTIKGIVIKMLWNKRITDPGNKYFKLFW